MEIIEQIKILKKQGLPEQEIIKNLQERGISPKQINDALNQAQIKTAISKTRTGVDGMQPSIMQKIEPLIDVPKPSSAQQEPVRKFYEPKTKEMLSSQNYPSQPLYKEQEELQQPISEDFPQQNLSQENYQNYPEPSPQQEEYAYQEPSINTDTVIEIAEQIFNDKISIITKQINDMEKFKTLTQLKVENLSSRMEKIESIINKLQLAILEKIGDYGKDIGSIKKEMQMMQDSFGKIITPLADKSSETFSQSKTPSVKAISKPRK